MKQRRFKKCKLSVNINKIATLRNSRGGDVPNVLQCAQDLISFGAEGITIHPRPDGRHIRSDDVYALAKLLRTLNKRRRPPSNFKVKSNLKSRANSKLKIEFNIEGYPNKEYFQFLKDTRPDQATLVPDPPHVLTSNAGWRLAKNEEFLHKVLPRIHDLGVRSSLFVDPANFTLAEADALARLKPHRIELYTENYARVFSHRSKSPALAKVVAQYAHVAQIADALGIEVNAGHDLTSENVGFLLKEIPQIIECSIGHALIAESLYLGFKQTLAKYKKAMNV